MQHYFLECPDIFTVASVRIPTMLVPAMPLTPTGKVVKGELAKMLETAQAH